MNEFGKLDYIELALRICNLSIDKKIINLILMLNNADRIENLNIKDILCLKDENEKEFKE